MDNQRELMGEQAKIQSGLNKEGAAIQYDMWKKTNYPAQMKMLKEAGLNAGLLYGQGGGGGTTTGGQGGGSAGSGGSAPQQMPMAMDINSIVTAIKAVADLGLTKAKTTKTDEERRGVTVESDVKEQGKQTMIDEYNLKGQELTKKEKQLDAESKAKDPYKYDDGNKTGWDKVAESELQEDIVQGILAEAIKNKTRIRS